MTAKELVLTQISSRAAKNLRHRANSDKDIQGDTVFCCTAFVESMDFSGKWQTQKPCSQKRQAITESFGLSCSHSLGKSRISGSRISSPFLFAPFIVKPVLGQSVAKLQCETVDDRIE